MREKTQAIDENELKELLAKKGTHKPMSKPTEEQLNKIVLSQGFG
jgi:hypothetical protein